MQRRYFYPGLLLFLFIYSCGSSDNFVGKWIVCNDPTNEIIITKSDGKYVLAASKKSDGTTTFVKKADDVLYSESNGSIIMFDKMLHHLMCTDHGEKIELCKSSQ
jgi:hypothetical protein